ncbi:IS5 family transposase [Novacetimonas hansenii]|uniref:IS5 family transposase n=1 Tax=Novacetimonas hansenii TaxID=436 RepID=UPI0007957763|nr:IS5 family transposase [Novacetimonas hansenii]RFO99769.1 hypothetical protein BGC30_10190 [Novacetimonas hansenii]WEQ58310.1 IS5 family transposase [Novacetimonas hansenii]CUW48546.1 Transposase DDE domain protein [Novacetimonas hansenii]
MYDTNLTDEQWELLEPYIFKAKPGGRPRSTNVREVINAIFYVLKTGCMWRSLPRDFPPWQTVYRYFRHLGTSKAFDNAFRDMYERLRVKDGRNPEPSLLIVDSQSVKTDKTAVSDTRGYDGGKRVKGRKRHLAVDSLGNIVDVFISNANLNDVKGTKKLFKSIQKMYTFTAIDLVIADKGYRGERFKKYVARRFGGEVEIGENHTSMETGFVPAKKRWLVERAFGWLNNYRRLAKDYEEMIEVSRHMIRMAAMRIMLRRLCPVPRKGKTWI